MTIIANYLQQVPHAFQQLLSEDKTPSLGKTLPAFEALKRKWEELGIKYPAIDHVIQPGLEKLQNYRELADVVPAYVMAMGKKNDNYLTSASLNIPSSVLSPSERLVYYEQHDPTNLASTKQLFIEVVSRM